MKHILTSLLVSALLVTGCGEDDNQPLSIGQVEEEPDENNTTPVMESLAIECDDTEREVGLRGSVYTDVSDLANSAYDQPLPADREPIAGVEVRLVSPTRTVTTATCADGTFRFAKLPVDEPFFVDPVIAGRVTSQNDPSRVADAVMEGPLDLVVFGDSIPAYGPTPWFPNVLKRKFDPYGATNLVNIAVPGSKSNEWVPGTPYFDTDLDPILEEADVIVFSLGGNDLQSFAYELSSAANPIAKVGELQPLMDTIIANLKLIIAEMRIQAPTADLVWVLYPNYATSTEWKNMLGQYASAGETVIKDLLVRARRELADEPGLIIVDIYGATADVDLDTILNDALHLNVEGHAFYADLIFRMLGGIEAGAPPVLYDYAVAPE